jgi:hypothetical protein
MFHHLTPTGRPYVFYNDHLPLLRRIPHFFIRKISPVASDLSKCLAKPGFHPSRIPSIKSLHRIRDFLSRRIDDNHQHKSSVPGYPDLWYGPELNECKSPVIMLFLTGVRQLSEVEALVSTHPFYAWLGRPFAPKSIGIPDEFLGRMGMSPASWKLREHFRQQFIYQMLKSAPTNKIPVIAVLPIEDTPDLDAFKSLDLFFPMLVQADSLESFVNTRRFEDATVGANPEFYNKTVHKIHQMDLKQFLEAFPTYLENLKQVPGIAVTDIPPGLNYFLMFNEYNKRCKI